MKPWTGWPYITARDINGRDDSGGRSLRGRNCFFPTGDPAPPGDDRGECRCPPSRENERKSGPRAVRLLIETLIAAMAYLPSPVGSAFRSGRISVLEFRMTSSPHRRPPLSSPGPRWKKWNSTLRPIRGGSNCSTLFPKIDGLLVTSHLTFLDRFSFYEAGSSLGRVRGFFD